LVVVVLVLVVVVVVLMMIMHDGDGDDAAAADDDDNDDDIPDDHGHVYNDADLLQVQQLLVTCDAQSAYHGITLLRCIVGSGVGGGGGGEADAGISGEDVVIVARACVKGLQAWGEPVAGDCGYAYAFACALAEALAGLNRAAQASLVVSWRACLLRLRGLFYLCLFVTRL